MQLDIATYIKPAWWTLAWGWIAFMPYEPNYTTPPFIPLTQTLRRPCRNPGSGRYQMPDYLINCWSQLELELTTATCLLQAHFDIPAIRPLYPFAFGYKKSHSHEGAAMKAIHKSKEWFAVWTALFSYMIAMGETKENEVHDYLHLSKKEWLDYLLEQGFQITWLESVINSMVFNFGPEIYTIWSFHPLIDSTLTPAFCEMVLRLQYTSLVPLGA